MSQVESLADLKPRDQFQRFTRTPSQVENDHLAAQLRSTGKTLREVGENFGVTAEAARKMILRAIADIPRGDTEALLALELAKLDQVEDRYWEIVQSMHPYVSQSGRVVVLDERDGTETVLLDDSPVMMALAGIVKVSAHRSRLLGLNAPVKAQVEVFNFDPDAIEYQVRLLERILETGSGEPSPVDYALSEARADTD